MFLEIKVTDASWHSLSLRIRGNRLEVDIDGLTVGYFLVENNKIFQLLWLEGQEVRRVASRLASLVLSSAGCYRSATIDFNSAQTVGSVERGVCSLTDRCLPSPCENGGLCEQRSLDNYECKCPDGYSGTNCHTSKFVTFHIQANFRRFTPFLRGMAVFAECQRKNNQRT